MDARYPRRSLLAAGALGAVGIAGCIEHFEEALYLGGIRIENRTTTDRSFEVEVIKEDVLVHESTYADVPGDPDGESGIYADCEWPNQERGQFEISIRETNEDAWSTTISTEAEREEYCQLCRIEYTEEDVTFSWEDCSEWRFGNDDPLCRYGF